MDPISLEDLALLDVLKRIDQHIELTHGDTEIRQRMRESGLIEDDEEGVRLTMAGIELCKSLQHRVAVDAQADKILKERAAAEASTDQPGVSAQPA
jgi:predicted methyltransferase